MSKKNKKKFIHEDCVEVHAAGSRVVTLYVDDSNLDAIANQIADIKAKFGSKYRRLYLDSRVNCACPYSGCSCSPTHSVMGEREETDEEYQARLSRETAARDAKKAKEDAEYALYLAMREKFKDRE